MLYPGINMVHSVKVDEGEMEIIKEKGGHIVHCPISNMYLGSGVAPVAEYTQMGINVCAGSDGPASNNTHNMFETIKMSACQQRAVKEDANVITVQDTIRMSTANGGIALGDETIGVLKEGNRADLILIDTRAAHMRPYHNAAATIAYSAQASDVDTVFVNGKMLLRGKKPLFVDEQKLIDECERRIRAVLTRSAYGKTKC
jgi:5-methylthioadenosine/S-adenosylhomocysteine deaminase